MGADGGVVYVPLKRPSDERFARVLDLLKPFWQFTDQSGVSSWADDANYEWFQKNPEIEGPKYLVGLWGTDRVDNRDLSHLRDICYTDLDDGVYSLSFEDLDLDRRTTFDTYTQHPLYDLWKQHFRWRTREETLVLLGSLATVSCLDWATELQGLLQFDHLVLEETWT